MAKTEYEKMTYAARKAQNIREEADKQKEDDFVADENRPHIPDGTYQVCFIRVEERTSHHNSLKMYLWFKIVNCIEHTDTELFMAMNLLDSKTGKRFKKVPRASKYYEQWVIANNNKLPSRNDRMSPQIFKGALFEGVVKTVKPEFADGTAKPDCFHYSIVHYLKRRLQ